MFFDKFQPFFTRIEKKTSFEELNLSYFFLRHTKMAKTFFATYEKVYQNNTKKYKIIQNKKVFPSFESYFYPLSKKVSWKFSKIETLSIDIETMKEMLIKKYQIVRHRVCDHHSSKGWYKWSLRWVPEGGGAVMINDRLYNSYKYEMRQNSK